MSASVARQRALAHALKFLTLQPVKRMLFKFDPFYENVVSVRHFLFQVNAPKSKDSNPKCIIKTDIKNDRSAPIIDVEFYNGATAVFKTENLTTAEIAQKFNEICVRNTVEEEGKGKGRR